MDFRKIKSSLSNHIENMIKERKYLYVVDIDKEALWEKYLDSFPAGTNKIFRERREHDCSACRHFIKSFGNVVVIKDKKMITIWDFETNDNNWQIVIDSLSEYIKSAKVNNFFITHDAIFGIDKNFEDKHDGNVIAWEHFYYKLPNEFIIKQKDLVENKKAELRDIRNVFKRSLDEISEDSILSILELILQKSIYRGDEWEAVLQKFLEYHKEYHKLDDNAKELFCWEESAIAGPVIGKIRNHSIGTLLIDITNNVDINEAVRKYEAIVAPSNYKRPKAIFTKKMLDDAKAKVEELGLTESLGRRFACLDDIRVNNILFANRDTINRINGGNVFEEMAQGISVNPRNFDKIEEIAVDTFVKNVLPSAQTMEILLENRHAGNMVSLIAPKTKDSPTLFKWNNGFSWAYSGNITDAMKERVKAAGGKVDGVLRFSIQWNEFGDDHNDNDAHCAEPHGNEIYFGNKGRMHPSTGMLDVDIIHPGDEIAVENITWTDLNRMPEGVYKLYVHCYTFRGGRSGFSAEIEFDGQIFSFNYNQTMRQNENVPVATVTYNRKTGFEIKELLSGTTSSRKIWNLDTNQFHPVSVCMYSPNFWDEQKGIGNRHYFFILKNCINAESPNGFFNEYLKENLMEHKRVFEALGGKMKVENSDNQLSGIGFSSTKRNSVICKISGHTNRALKINF